MDDFECIDTCPSKMHIQSTAVTYTTDSGHNECHWTIEECNGFEYLDHTNHPAFIPLVSGGMNCDITCPDETCCIFSQENPTAIDPIPFPSTCDFDDFAIYFRTWTGRLCCCQVDSNTWQVYVELTVTDLIYAVLDPPPGPPFYTRAVQWWDFFFFDEKPTCEWFRGRSFTLTNNNFLGTYDPLTDLPCQVETLMATVRF